MPRQLLLGIIFGVVIHASSAPATGQGTCSPSHERLHAVLWMQRSGEFQGITRQAFQLASANLRQALANPASWPEAVTPTAADAKRSPAIIVDVDETVLSNTPEEAMLIAAGKRKFDPAIWEAWEARAEARALEGAAEFLQLASSRGVTVFYVSNRDNEVKLRNNLAAQKLPLASGQDVVLLPGECSSGDKTSDKECRRQDIAKHYRVLLLVGDDLGDFFSIGGMKLDQRQERVRESSARWGREWIIIPNPAYGSWERAFYDPKDEGDVILYKKLIGLEAPQ